MRHNEFTAHIFYKSISMKYMKKSEVRTAVHNGFSRFLTPEGFKRHKPDFFFRRLTDYGFQEVGNTLVDYSPIFVFQFYVRIRFDAIENILDAALPRSLDHRGETSSVHIDSDFFVGRNLRYEVKNLNDIEIAIQETEEVFKSLVFPLFEKCCNFKSIERLLNEKINIDPKVHILSVAQAGVVAAALCKRPDFSEIVSRYRDAMIDYQESSRTDFENVVAYVIAKIL